MDEFVIGPNSGQQNADRVGANINDMVLQNMQRSGALKDTGPKGRHFYGDLRNIFGYNGLVVENGKIVSLLNLDADENIPSIGLDTELTVVGDSRGYLTSGHKPGTKVRIIGFIEPDYPSGVPGIRSSDKIIQVEGDGIIGWIKPKEFDKNLLLEQKRKLKESLGKVSSE